MPTNPQLLTESEDNGTVGRAASDDIKQNHKSH
jgi:hypothetical protein